MSIVRGDVVATKLSPWKRFEFLPLPKRETYLSSNSVVLTTGTPYLVEFTLQDSDMPVIVPKPVSVTYAPIVTLAGNNASGASINIGYRLYKNGAEISNGASAGIATGLNWTLNIVQTSWFNTSVGTKLGIELWISTGTTATLDFIGLAVQPTRVLLTKPNTSIKDVKWDFDSGTSTHSYTVGKSPVANFTASAVGLNGNFMMTGVGPGAISLPYFSNTGGNYFGDTATNMNYAHLSVGFGDYNWRNTVSTRSHATSHPFYEANRIPKFIHFREMG